MLILSTYNININYTDTEFKNKILSHKKYRMLLKNNILSFFCFNKVLKYIYYKTIKKINNNEKKSIY